MKIYRFNIIWLIAIFYLVIGIDLGLLIPGLYGLILGIVFLAIAILHTGATLYYYFNYLWWPYHNWIDTDVVNIEKIEIPSTLPGENLKAIIIRAKNSNPNIKHVGILFHHGYTGHKEKVLRFAIPLAMSGCVVVCPDGRGHGESTNKAFDMSDFLGIVSDVKNEIDYLESLNDVDPDKLVMMGHSMGAIATLYNYPEERLKKIVEISGAYDLFGMFHERKTLVQKFIYRRITKVLKKNTEFNGTDDSLMEFNKKISAKYRFEYEHSIPDKDRVYLIHCKDDVLVLFSEAVQIKEALNLPDENTLFLEKPKKKFMSAHNLTGQATIIATYCVQVATSLNE